MKACFLLLFVSAVTAAWGQSSSQAADFSPSDLEAIVETELGSFRFEFAHDKAPKHVAHFLKLIRDGYYDGSAFFRAVAGGMIQGGDPLLKNPKTPKNLWGSGGLNMLPSEFSDLKHERGVLSTVRIPDKPNTDGAQFFVCVSQQPALDGQYSTFGRVTEGMDVVERISQAPAGENGFVEKPVRILRITLDKKKTEPWVSASVEDMKRIVTLKTTVGALKVQLMPEWAPSHVRNFLKLVETGWLNGTGFHRLVKGFVVQGGMENSRSDPKQRHWAERWVRPLKGEFRDDVKHVRGIVSMARSDDPDSATTSFFLMLGDAPHLDGKYSAFGRVVEGLETLEAFEKEEVEGETPKRRLEVVEAAIDSK